jgi:hypothetical protein
VILSETLWNQTVKSHVFLSLFVVTVRFFSVDHATDSAQSGSIAECRTIDILAQGTQRAHYAWKVHQRAEYLRKLEAYEKGRWLIRPKEPAEPTKVITVMRDGEDLGNFFIKSETRVKDAVTLEALPYHSDEISRLNKCIEEEFLRLVREQRRKVDKTVESRLSKWLGLRHIWNTDTGWVRSSTAFVEFKSIVAKQAAIQCNITGTCGLLEIEPVPGKCYNPISCPFPSKLNSVSRSVRFTEIRDIVWDNAHISRRLIEYRVAWANIALGGLLIGWSCLVTLIRSVDSASTAWFGGIEIAQIGYVASFIDDYLPAFVVEALVRTMPFLLRAVSEWSREKSFSARDTYVLRWYFGFRLCTFIFVIIGGSLVGSADSLVHDPM